MNETAVKEKKKIHVGKWMPTIILLYVTGVLYISIRRGDELHFMWPYILFFAACGLVVSPLLERCKMWPRMIAILTAFAVITAAICIAEQMSFWTMIGCLIGLGLMSLLIIRILGFAIAFVFFLLAMAFCVPAVIVI